jgi:Glycolipid 2-alpha-mannosyltransferase
VTSDLSLYSKEMPKCPSLFLQAASSKKGGSLAPYRGRYARSLDDDCCCLPKTARTCQRNSVWPAMRFPRPAERTTIARMSSTPSKRPGAAARVGSISVVAVFVVLTLLATGVTLMGTHSFVLSSSQSEQERSLDRQSSNGKQHTGIGRREDVGKLSSGADERHSNIRMNRPKVPAEDRSVVVQQPRPGDQSSRQQSRQQPPQDRIADVQHAGQSTPEAATNPKDKEAPGPDGSLPMMTSDGAKSGAKLGTVVFLAGRRNEITFFNTIDRFCFLLRAIRSFDEHVNRHYGPYPIHVLIATDHDKDDKKFDAEYTEADRNLIRAWAPHSEVIFVNVSLYSGEALSPGITDALIEQYRQQDRAAGRPPVRIGYASMCRLWSFRLQAMDFLTPFRYYMRMDDDSLLFDKPEEDPFLKMQERKLQYLWQRPASDRNGVAELSQIADPYLTEDSRHSRFAVTSGGGKLVSLSGMSPYNNFHITEVAFWRSPKWRQVMDEVDRKHLFYSRQLGDATTHALATLFMKPGTYESWSLFPYGHNTNDMGKSFHKDEYKEECKQAYIAASIPVPTYKYIE